MAIVTNPLFSLSARGQVGKTWIYQHNRGITIAKHYGKPKPYQATGRQTGIRATVRYLMKTFDITLLDAPIYWQELADRNKTSPRIEYCAYNVRRMVENLPPVNDVPTDNTFDNAAAHGLSLTNTARTVHVLASTTGRYANALAFAIYRSTASAIATTIDTLVFIQPWAYPFVAHDDKPTAAGTYYYRVRTFDSNGHWTGAIGPTAITIP